jgi:RNA polymerase-binding transcription factor DksA
LTVGPEYADEERLRQQVEQLKEQSEGILAEDRADAPEREVAEHDLQERELYRLDAEANEAHAPAGQICERCGQPINANQDARHRADGGWVHEECPGQR